MISLLVSPTCEVKCSLQHVKADSPSQTRPIVQKLPRQHRFCWYERLVYTKDHEAEDSYYGRDDDVPRRPRILGPAPGEADDRRGRGTNHQYFTP